MSLLRRERRQWQPEPFVPPFPGVSMTGRGGVPSALAAMQASAVWACVRLVASSVAMMPLRTYTLNGDVRIPAQPSSLFVEPSGGVTMPDWVYMIMSSLLLRGNAYGKVSARDSEGFPLMIDLLNPDDVTVRKGIDRDTAYTFYLKGQPITPFDLFHVKAYRLPGYPVGLSPIQQAALTINRDNAIQQFALGYFQDAPKPASVLTSDQPVSADEATTIKKRVKSALDGRDLLVLGAGLKFNPLSVSPEESQFLATQKYGAAEICRFFGVPPQKVPGADVGNSMTYATVELSSIDLLTYTIQWWLTCLEAALAPLQPGNRHVRFDTSVLLRTDLETTVKSSAIGIAAKFLTPDEARQRLDYPPLTADQKALLDLVPLAISPTGMPKALPIAAQEQNPVLGGLDTGGGNA